MRQICEVYVLQQTNGKFLSRRYTGRKTFGFTYNINAAMEFSTKEVAEEMKKKVAPIKTKILKLEVTKEIVQE